MNDVIEAAHAGRTGSSAAPAGIIYWAGYFQKPNEYVRKIDCFR